MLSERELQRALDLAVIVGLIKVVSICGEAHYVKYDWKPVRIDLDTSAPDGYKMRLRGRA